MTKSEKAYAIINRLHSRLGLPLDREPVILDSTAEDRMVVRYDLGLGFVTVTFSWNNKHQDWAISDWIVSE